MKARTSLIIMILSIIVMNQEQGNSVLQFLWGISAIVWLLKTIIDGVNEIRGKG